MKIKKKVYYAHPLSLYGTEQETRDVATLESLGFEVVNPNQPVHDLAYKSEGMEHFRKMVRQSDFLVFRGFPDGSIPAGITHEIKEAEQNNIPFLELPSAVLRRGLNVEETRQALREVGYR